MVVKKLFKSSYRSNYFVVEMPNGQYMKFFDTPSRTITEKDLSPVPGYQAKGNKGKEAPYYFYNFYGLEKQKDLSERLKAKDDENSVKKEDRDVLEL